MYDTPEELTDRLHRAIVTGPEDGSSDFDLNPEFELPAGRKLRPAGVHEQQFGVG